MNRIIRLTSTSKDDNGDNIIVRVFVDSIGQYWNQPIKIGQYFDRPITSESETQEINTIVRFKDGKSFPYKETPEEIDKMLGVEEPKL